MALDEWVYPIATDGRVRRSGRASNGPARPCQRPALRSWRRRAVGILALSFHCAAASASAQSAEAIDPDSVAAEFQAALQAMAWRAAALRLHAEGLRRFNDRIDVLVDLDESGSTREAIFGRISEAEYRSLTSRDVFVRAMAALMDEMPGLLHALVVRKVHILGSVIEPPELAHVVYRSEAQLSGAVPEMRVMTLKRGTEGWRVLESQELDVIREALGGFIRRAEPPPPNR